MLRPLPLSPALPPRRAPPPANLPHPNLAILPTFSVGTGKIAHPAQPSPAPQLAPGKANPHFGGGQSRLRPSWSLPLPFAVAFFVPASTTADAAVAVVQTRGGFGQPPSLYSVASTAAARTPSRLSTLVVLLQLRREPP